MTTSNDYHIAAGVVISYIHGLYYLLQQPPTRAEFFDIDEASANQNIGYFLLKMYSSCQQ